jgi:hypothetical protein
LVSILRNIRRHSGCSLLLSSTLLRRQSCIVRYVTLFALIGYRKISKNKLSQTHSIMSKKVGKAVNSAARDTATQSLGALYSQASFSTSTTHSTTCLDSTTSSAKKRKVSKKIGEIQRQKTTHFLYEVSWNFQSPHKGSIFASTTDVPVSGSPNGPPIHRPFFKPQYLDALGKVVVAVTSNGPPAVHKRKNAFGTLPVEQSNGLANESLLLVTPVQSKGVGQRLFVGLDTGGLHYRFLQRARLILPELANSAAQTKTTQSRYHGEPYFTYSAWWLQCTNLHSLPKRGTGCAIAIVSNNLGTKVVELGAVVEHTSYHMVYVLYQNKVFPYPNGHQAHATFQQSWFDLVDPAMSKMINSHSTFDGIFSQPFRILLKELLVPKPTVSIHFLSQCYGASPSSVVEVNNKLMASCWSTDNCFQCSPESPSLLFPNKWRLPFYQESCFLAETATRREGKANEVGKIRPSFAQYEQPFLDSWKSVDTHAYARLKCNLEMDSCADSIFWFPKTNYRTR